MDALLTEKRLDTIRGPVYYYVNGTPRADRETLVFLHGLTADHTLFDKQVEYFAPRYNLLLWDAPAHGKSRPYADFSYANAANDLLRIVTENSMHAAVLIGQSMGGYVIQSFLLRYPQMARAFIGIDTCPYGDRYYSASDIWWLKQVEWMSRLYPSAVLKKAIAKQCAITAYGRANMLSALAPYDKKELCHLMGIGYAEFLADNRDMEIACPVLLLCGEKDRTGKVRRYCAAWHAATGFPLTIIKNAAHNANADNPEAVNAAIEGFLDKLN